MIKDQMDKKFGSPWHVIVGRAFAYEVTYEVCCWTEALPVPRGGGRGCTCGTGTLSWQDADHPPPSTMPHHLHSCATCSICTSAAPLASCCGKCEGLSAALKCQTAAAGDRRGGFRETADLLMPAAAPCWQTIARSAALLASGAGPAALAPAPISIQWLPAGPGRSEDTCFCRETRPSSCAGDALSTTYASQVIPTAGWQLSCKAPP
jgi:hypothetical protein